MNTLSVHLAQVHASPEVGPLVLLIVGGALAAIVFRQLMTFIGIVGRLAQLAAVAGLGMLFVFAAIILTLVAILASLT